MIELDYRFIPLRANSDDEYIVLEIKLRNSSKDQKLVSLDIICPHREISLDQYRVKKREEIKVGFLNGNESRTYYHKIYLTPGIQPGLYDIKLSLYIHDRDYSSYVDKYDQIIHLRVV